MARRTLGLGADVAPSVTGGLTFFGAPLNDYMSHAACAMVRRLREAAGCGLLYGQGEFVTKHHGLVLASRPPPRPLQSWSASVQAEADKRRGAVPPFLVEATGPAFLETFTVIFDRDGAVNHGVVILRTRDGGRALARVPAADGATLGLLTDLDHTALGIDGVLTSNADGISDWRARS